MLVWLSENKDWVFSGAGIFIISTLITLFVKSNNKKQLQKVGNNSTAIQVGNDLRVGDEDVKK